MRIIITGGNSGVGKATAAAMAAAGHEVVIAYRSVSKGRDAVKTMSGDVKVAELDLADLDGTGADASSGRRNACAPTRGCCAYLSDPGMTDTGITKDGSALLRWTTRVLAPRIAQTPEQGARSTIQAISTDLPNGAYIAPGGLLHQWGKPRATKVAAKARDSNSSSRLWQLSVELTGCDW